LLSLVAIGGNRWQQVATFASDISDNWDRRQTFSVIFDGDLDSEEVGIGMFMLGVVESLAFL
jgi:hypothetical protein